MVLPVKYPLRAMIIGAIFAVMILGWCLQAHGDEGLAAAVRYTGRFSALLFLPVFAARPLVDLFGTEPFRKLLRQRGHLGLSLAGNHHVHMVLVTMLLIGEGAGAAAFYANPALYIYMLLVGMNITSFQTVKARMPKVLVGRLHLIGMYALAVAFFSTVIRSQWTGEKHSLFGQIYTVLFFIVLGFRMAAFVRKRRTVRSG